MRAGCSACQYNYARNPLLIAYTNFTLPVNRAAARAACPLPPTLMPSCVSSTADQWSTSAALAVHPVAYSPASLQIISFYRSVHRLWIQLESGKRSEQGRVRRVSPKAFRGRHFGVGRFEMESFEMESFEKECFKEDRYEIGPFEMRKRGY